MLEPATELSSRESERGRLPPSLTTSGCSLGDVDAADAPPPQPLSLDRERGGAYCRCRWPWPMLAFEAVVGVAFRTPFLYPDPREAPESPSASPGTFAMETLSSASSALDAKPLSQELRKPKHPQQPRHLLRHHISSCWKGRSNVFVIGDRFALLRDAAVPPHAEERLLKKERRGSLPVPSITVAAGVPLSAPWAATHVASARLDGCCRDEDNDCSSDGGGFSRLLESSGRQSTSPIEIKAEGCCGGPSDSVRGNTTSAFGDEGQAEG